MSHTDRQGGPGSSHQNRQDPGKSAPPTGHKHAQPPQGPRPGEPTNPDRSRVSGGGGERDRHHTHDSRERS